MRRSIPFHGRPAHVRDQVPPEDVDEMVDVLTDRCRICGTTLVSRPAWGGCVRTPGDGTGGGPVCREGTQTVAPAGPVLRQAHASKATCAVGPAQSRRAVASARSRGESGEDPPTAW